MSSVDGGLKAYNYCIIVMESLKPGTIIRVNA